MSEPRPDLPTSPAEAATLLHSMFGIGSYDDIAQADPPWWKTQGVEVYKLKALMKRRNATPEQVGKAAWYAKTQGIHVYSTNRLFPLIPLAIRAWREADAEESRERTLTEVSVVIEEAQEAGDDEFVGRLLRADATQLPLLVTEWRSR